MIKFNSLLLTFTSIILLFSCKKQIEVTKLKQGIWRAEINMQNQKLPFNFNVSKDGSTYNAALINGVEETIPLDEIEVVGDSVFITLHIFDIELRAKINGDSLNGLYIKNYKDDYRIPFTATHNNSNRFIHPQSNSNFDGKWQVTFVEEDSITYPAIGVFKKEGDLLKGTFLTETGDYRYLEGIAKDSTMSLYTYVVLHYDQPITNDKIF